MNRIAVDTLLWDKKNSITLASNKLTDHHIDSGILVEMIKAKSEKGFNILYDRYADTLYYAIVKIVNHADEADDLLQDAFVKIWRHIDQFEPTKGSLYTWMLNIAKNHAIDYLRSSNHQKNGLNIGIDLSAIKIDAMIDVHNTLNALEFADIKKRAMKLDAKYAEVIELIFFSGWTYKQASMILRLPIGTVKSRARKGLCLLKDLYLH